MTAKSRATLNSEADTTLPNNTTGEISPTDVRTAVKDLADSAVILADDKASDANVRAAASNKVLTADLIESASAEVTLTDAATIALDWDTGINFIVTLGGNRTLGAPTNGQPGTWRTLRPVQDGTGSRTLSYDAVFDHPGGTAPTLSTAASDYDLLHIYCRTTTSFLVLVGGKDFS